MKALENNRNIAKPARGKRQECTENRLVGKNQANCGPNGPTDMRRGPTYKLSMHKHVVTCASNVNTIFPYILECVDL